MKENRLVEIPLADWPKLRDLYVTRKSQSDAYNLIQNYIDWLKKDPSIDFAKFYSLNGDWSDGTFILQDAYLVLFDTLDKGNKGHRLFEALCLLDYSRLRVFNGYDSRLQWVVEKVMKEKNVNDNDRLNGGFDLFVLRQAVALELGERTLPDGVRISPLNEPHAEVIDSIWDFRHDGSLNATRELIKYGKSLGAYTDDGQLVAWIIVQQTGAIGLLKVREDFRRLGIASLLVTTIAKEIASTGQDDSNYYIMLNTLNDCQDRLVAALNCLDRKSAYLFNGFPDHLMPAIERYMLQFGIKRDLAQCTATIWYHISLEQALDFNTGPPEGITLAALTQKDVDTVNGIWPHRHPGSEVYVGRLIALSPSIGAYDKEGNLLSWCLKLPIGSLGILHVKDDHKRRGFGNLMVRALSKIFAQMGVEVTAPVVEANVASRSMFKKLGFQEIDKVHWWGKPALE